MRKGVRMNCAPPCEVCHSSARFTQNVIGKARLRDARRPSHDLRLPGPPPMSRNSSGHAPSQPLAFTAAWGANWCVVLGMSMTSKSPRRVLLVAYETGMEALATYSHPCSPQTFTQPQLLACLVLKTFLRRVPLAARPPVLHRSWSRPASSQPA